MSNESKYRGKVQTAKSSQPKTRRERKAERERIKNERRKNHSEIQRKHGFMHGFVVGLYRKRKKR